MFACASIFEIFFLHTEAETSSQAGGVGNHA